MSFATALVSFIKALVSFHQGLAIFPPDACVEDRYNAHPQLFLQAGFTASRFTEQLQVAPDFGSSRHTNGLSSPQGVPARRFQRVSSWLAQ